MGRKVDAMSAVGVSLVFQVIRTEVRFPFADRVLAVATFQDRRTALDVARSWAELPEVQAGLERVKVVSR
jgi:hypothetical protein